MKKRKKIKLLKNIYLLIFISSITAIGYCIYKMYQNIDISSDYTAEKVNLSTESEQNVENIEQKSENVTDMLEKVTRKCMWNFKIKHNRRVNFINCK